MTNLNVEAGEASPASRFVVETQPVAHNPMSDVGNIDFLSSEFYDPTILSSFLEEKSLRLFPCCQAFKDTMLLVHLYTHDEFYRPFNTIIKNKETKYFPLVRSLTQHIISKSTKAPILLYRGFRNTGLPEKGSKLMFHVFTSCTKERKVAETFAGREGFVLEIETSQATFGFDIEQYSAFPQEKEFLLAPMHTIEVIEIESNRTVSCSVKLTPDENPFVWKTIPRNEGLDELPCCCSCLMLCCLCPLFMILDLFITPVFFIRGFFISFFRFIRLPYYYFRDPATYTNVVVEFMTCKVFSEYSTTELFIIACCMPLWKKVIFSILWITFIYQILASLFLISRMMITTRGCCPFCISNYPCFRSCAPPKKSQKESEEDEDEGQNED